MKNRVGSIQIYDTQTHTHTHTLHLGLTAEVVKGQNHSECFYIKASIVLQIPSSSATKPCRREKTQKEERELRCGLLTVQVGPHYCLSKRKGYNSHVCIQRVVLWHLHILFSHTHTHTVNQSLRAFGAWQTPWFSSKCDHKVVFHFCPLANITSDHLQKGADHNLHTQIQSLTVLSLFFPHSFGRCPCRSQDEKGLKLAVCCPWLHYVYSR